MNVKPKKQIISLDVDSALSLMQEIYNDISEQKTFASLIMKKMYSFMKESEDMSVIGPVIKEQQKILNNCTEKKLSLVKIQSVLLKQITEDKNGLGKVALSDEDMNLISKLLDEKNNDSNIDTKSYELK